MTHPNSPDLTGSVRASLGGLKLKPQDAAAQQLAVRYAEQIDASPDLLVKLGPLLLAVLESLGMTPRGRAAVLGKGVRGDSDSTDGHGDDCKCLPCQRKRRGVRRNRASTVDTPAG